MSDGENQGDVVEIGAESELDDDMRKIRLGISGQGEDGSEAKPPPKPGDADKSANP